MEGRMSKGCMCPQQHDDVRCTGLFDSGTMESFDSCLAEEKRVRVDVMPLNNIPRKVNKQKGKRHPVNE
jgi:hypothetical protein